MVVVNVFHCFCALTDVPEVHVSRVQEVSLVNHVPHPLAVVHVTLTSLYAGKLNVTLTSRYLVDINVITSDCVPR